MALFEGSALDPSVCNSVRTFLSSVGGFSQPARKQIRSLQDLLQTMQRFDLEYTPGTDLEHVRDVGEGVSYKVSCSKRRKSGTVVAVKQVKLPSAATDMGAFERQVACVLRDVEVMTGLKNHANVLNLRGYGWNTFSSGYIPFLITEYADAGSLRQFLREKKVSVYEKLRLCDDVSKGLHALHNFGIAHGDLKLDNVLVVPLNPETATEISTTNFLDRTHRIKACLSDFGHALHLIHGNEDFLGWERYGGTLAYNAPEVSEMGNSPHEALDFCKCDIWSFGLLCWETLRDGREFFTHLGIQKAVTSTSSAIRSSDNPATCLGLTVTEKSSHISTSTLVAELGAAASTFAELAGEEATEIVASQVSHRTTRQLIELFRLSLCARPEERAADMAFLPPFSCSATKAYSRNASATILQPWDSWSSEVFRRLRHLPHEVRQNILNDSKRIASTHDDTVSAGKAAFQAGIAYLSGFGCEYEPSEALHWLSLSAAKGSELAQCFLPFLGNAQCSMGGITPTQCFKELLRAKFVAKSSNDFHDHGKSPANGTHHALKVKFHLACQSGNVEEIRSLQRIRLEGNERDGWSSCPLHWIFMFPEQDIEDMTRLIVSDVCIRDAYRNAVTRSCISIDPQLPVTLSGTPLAFATAVYSVTAVQELLHIGADPFAGTRPDSFEGSAWYIACKYHLSDILSLFRGYTEILLYPDERASYVLRLFKCSAVAFSEATLSDRVFFHGAQTSQAARRTAMLLLNHFKPDYQIGMSIRLLETGDLGILDNLLLKRPEASRFHACSTCKQVKEAADCIWCSSQANVAAALCIPIIHSGDAETLRMVFEVMSDTIQHPKYRRSIFNKLFVHSTTKACAGVLHTEDSQKILKACLTLGAHIDCKEDHFEGSLPINCAIQHGNVDLFEWFIQQGADVTAKSARGDTPLHFAISCGFSTRVDLSLFLGLGASGDYENEDGLSPLHLGIKLDREDDFKKIFDHVVRSGKDPKYQSLVELASAYPNTGILSYILKGSRKSPFSADFELTQALANAIENERPSNVRVLVSSGAPVSKPLQSSWSCLHMAVSRGSKDCVRELLRADCLEIGRRCVWPASEPNSILKGKGQGLTQPFAADWTALQVAVFKPNSRSCAYLLLDAGADAAIEDACGITVVELAVQCPRPRNWQSLAAKLLSNDRIKPLDLLQRALESQDFEWATFLVRSGLPKGLMSESGRSPLHSLAESHQNITDNRKEYFKPIFDLTKMIIMAGAEPNQTDEEGHTPLELSALRNNAPVCAALLEYHIDEEHDEKREGWTAGHLLEALPSSTKRLLERAWSCAVKCTAWATICEFHRSGIMLSTAELDFDNGRALFQYAFQNDMKATLRLFVGSYDDSGHCVSDGDPHLHQYWQTICARESIISERGSRIMDLKMGHTPIISPRKMIELEYYEALAKVSLKVCVSIDFGNNPDPLEVHIIGNL